MKLESKQEKKSYQSPSLRIYGDIHKVTQQGGKGPTSDSGSNMMGSH